MLNTLYTYFPTHLVTKRLSLVSIGYALTMLACVEAAEQSSLTKLLESASKEQLDKVTAFLLKDNVVTTKDVPQEDQAFYNACNMKDYDKIKSLMTKDRANIKINGQSLLLHVAGWDSNTCKIAVLKLVIRYGGHINVQNVISQTGLHIACLHQDIFTAHFLLAKGINYTQSDINGNTALHYVCSYHAKGLDFVMLLTSVHNLDALLKKKNKSGKTPMDIVKEKNDNHYKKIVDLVDQQKVISAHSLQIAQGFTREHASYVVVSIMHIIGSYLLFQRLRTT